MPRASLASILTLALLASPAHAGPGTPEELLGDAWRQASPAERIVLLSIAGGERALDRKTVDAAVEETVRAALAPGQTPEARLRLLGDLRREADERLKVKNEERKRAKSRAVGFAEPDDATQQALALEYVAAAAGAAPSLEALGCLRLVREATSWTAHHQLVLALVTEALSRDAPYREADLEGKLGIIKKLARDRAMLTHQERKYLEQPLVADHMAARLRAGDAPAAIAATVKAWKDKDLVSYFTQAWAESMLERLGELRAARGR
jgi:hypothetical protein